MFLSAGISISALAPGVKTVNTLDEASSLIPPHPQEDVLVISGPREGARVSRVARAVAEHDRVAVVTVPGTPTRQAAIAALLLSIPTTHLGVAQAVVDASRTVVVTRLAMTSVSRLEVGRPSVMQHLRSFFPGASFDVDVVTNKVASVRPVDWSGLPTALTIEAGSEPPGQKRSIAVVAPQAGFHLPLDRSTWKARSWVERSALPDSPGRLAFALAQQAGCSGCHRCSRLAGPTGCLFCGTHRVPAVRRRPGSTSPSPKER